MEVQVPCNATARARLWVFGERVGVKHKKHQQMGRSTLPVSHYFKCGRIPHSLSMLWSTGFSCSLDRI